MLTTEEFRALLKDCGIECVSQFDLKALIDSETEKQYDKINADLIEYCLDLLDVFENTSSSVPQQDRIAEQEYKFIVNNYGRSFLINSYTAANERRSIGF